MLWTLVTQLIFLKLPIHTSPKLLLRPRLPSLNVTVYVSSCCNKATVSIIHLPQLLLLPSPHSWKGLQKAPAFARPPPKRATNPRPPAWLVSTAHLAKSMGGLLSPLVRPLGDRGWCWCSPLNGSPSTRSSSLSSSPAGGGRGWSSRVCEEEARPTALYLTPPRAPEAPTHLF